MEMKKMNKNATLSAAISIFLYTTKEYKVYTIDNDTCSERICQQICKELEIKPLVCTLFALCIDDTSLFLPGCRKLEPKNKYNFRLRFQIKELPDLKTLDKNAYDYLYQQVNWDLINGKIPELVYPNHKAKVVGLCVTNMYVEMLEHQSSVRELKRNYRKYVPRKFVKQHSIFMQHQMGKELKQIKNLMHDVNYVKTTYLQEIATYAPSYFVEKCAAIAPYLPEDGLTQGTCPIELEFAPFHPDRPGLSIYYSYKKLWKHIAKIEDIFTVIVNGDNLTFETRINYVGFSVRIADKSRLESFVSCVIGYYRLMVKWTMDLCQSLKSPLLQELQDLKCHGPIGADFSYFKLHDKQSIPGSYIIRQCEDVYDIYYIDIIKKFVHPETFKITKQRFDGNITWDLHTSNETLSFNDLQDLAKSIKTDSVNKFRLAPSEYDKASLLLLCIPLSQLAVTKSATVDIENQLRHNRVQIIDPSKELRKYINTQKIVENGMMKQIRAEWLLPSDTKVDVTLRILNSKDHYSEFMKLAEKWSGLQSTDMIKLYGLTLSSPYSMVIESTRLGPFDEFLQENGNISIVCLVDASYSLARALYYLEENNIIHGNIRCGSMYVVKFNGSSLVVRLGDPKFQNSYTKDDLPWIPVEYYDHMHQAMSDNKAEIFAYSTTLWEIFSKGIKPPIQNSLASRRRLPRPKICPSDMYEIMLSGWDIPQRRFSPQHIFSTLVGIRDVYQKIYTTIEPNTLENRDRQLSTSSNATTMSAATERTRLMSEGYISNIGSENGQSNSHGYVSNVSTENEHSKSYGNNADFMLATAERIRLISEGYVSNFSSDNEHYKSDENISNYCREDEQSTCNKHIVYATIEHKQTDGKISNVCGENELLTSASTSNGCDVNKQSTSAITSNGCDKNEQSTSECISNGCDENEQSISGCISNGCYVNEQSTSVGTPNDCDKDEQSTSECISNACDENELSRSDEYVLMSWSKNEQSKSDGYILMSCRAKDQNSVHTPKVTDEIEQWKFSGYIPNGCENELSKSIGNLSNISNISNLSNISNVSFISNISSKNRQWKFNGYISNVSSENGNVSSISSESEHSKSVNNISNVSNNMECSISSNNSKVNDKSEDNSKIKDGCKCNKTDTQAENLKSLSNDADDDFKNTRIIIELDAVTSLIYNNNNYIGKGQYGTVYKGILIHEEAKTIEVAIKTLNQCPSKNEFHDFKREIYVMKGLKHPNIVKIITWTDEPHTAIIMEYVKHGSFLKYLTKSRSTLTIQCLLHFAEDIAFGMEYLANKNIVHRDLAARNVLIDSNNHVKISDFGLSQFVNDKGYYRSQNRRFIPYKWYAPETLTEEKYSLQSDVWSYGITLFEIFSKGKEPNLEAHEQGNVDDFVHCLNKGHRLPKPEHCPENVYNSVLMECWEQEREKRPTFTRILKQLNNFIAEYGEVI